ncbi:deoxycytidylate deaminase [Candidatus Saccharibacteria bacterium]|nr:MAG: deoxycytidylate deaminase [Candidatus Saccharibacteria bacterium]
MASQHIICYVPVIHEGYVNFFAKYPGASIGVLGKDVLSKRFDYLRKDIRALHPEKVATILRGIGRVAEVIDEPTLKEVLRSGGVVMPDDDISHALAKEFGASEVTFEPVFLRWDRQAIDTNQVVHPDKVLSVAGNDSIIAALYAEASKSTNWWRTVGAAIVADGELVATAHNGSVPTAFSSAIDGDPRILANRGSAIDTSIDIHAESRLIGKAAAEGKKLSGTSIYVSTFPCPTCAKLIAASGITQCYYVEGYASIDGQSILKNNAVEIIKITAKTPATSRQKLKKYPTS